MDYLIYIGDGSALYNVPARNLTKGEAEKFGVELLLASGLYQMAETPKKANVKKSQEIKDDSDDT